MSHLIFSYHTLNALTRLFPSHDQHATCSILLLTCMSTRPRIAKLLYKETLDINLDILMLLGFCNFCFLIWFMLLDHRQEVPLRSDKALRIHKKLVDSFLNGQKIFDYWRLSKVESLENEKFEMEYSRKCLTRVECNSYTSVFCIKRCQYSMCSQRDTSWAHRGVSLMKHFTISLFSHGIHWFLNSMEIVFTYLGFFCLKQTADNIATAMFAFHD